MRRFLLFVGIIIFIVSSIAFAQALTVEGIINDASPSVVKIIVYDITGTKRGEGSGFFISHGNIVTNAHVVNGAYSAEVHSPLNVYEQITITKRDDEVDLALLAVKDIGESSIALADSGDLRPGQRVLAIGNPLGLEGTVSDGLISAVRGTPGKLQLIQISAPISPGSSGGPLLNLQGAVIGVTSASMSEGQNLNFAIGIETLKQFLQRPANPEPLKMAQARVLWRTILKWVINIVVGLIALAFGGGYWIIFIVIMVLIFLFHILKALWGLITTLFQRKDKSETLLVDEDRYQTTSEDKHPEQTPLFTEENEDTKDEADGENVFHFHCWKCGELVEVDKSEGDDTIECEGCGTKVEIPKQYHESKNVDIVRNREEKRGTILLVAADDNFIDYFSHSAVRNSYDLSILVSFDEVIPRLEERRFDIIVLTNSGLSPFNIPDVVDQIRNQYKTINILVCSGYDSEEYIEDLFKRGVNDFLSMPFDIDAFCTIVNKAINKKKITEKITGKITGSGTEN